MFAKGGKRITGAAGEADQGRGERFESNRVADHVGPHARAGRNDDRIVDPGLDRPQPVASWTGRIQLVDRDELIEDPVIVDQAQQPGRRIAECDESLGAGVDFLQPDRGEPRID